MTAERPRPAPDDRVYRLLLRLYPADFRGRFGREMRETFADDHRRACGLGGRARAAFWIRTLAEAVAYGLGERCRPRPSVHRDDSLLGGATMMSRLAVDLRDALRALRTTPIVTAAAVLSLALGIGANTALFSILDSLVLRSLPVREPQQLVVIQHGSWTNPIWEQIRDRQGQIAESAFAWSGERFDLAQRGETDFVDGAYASGGMFETLGLAAARGRLIAPSDDVRGAGARGGVVVVSHDFWKRRFGGADDVVGRTLTIDRVPFTVVGVMPAGFTGPDIGRTCDVVIPLADEPLIRGAETMLDGRATWWLDIMLRLKPGQTPDQAAAALNGVLPQIRAATTPEDWPPAMVTRYLNEPFTLRSAATGQSDLRDRFSQPLVAMMAVVAAVLLIACANIANLLLARATARRRDLSVRLALGASRLRLARQLFCESLLLAGTGAVLGLLIARVGSALLVRQFGDTVVLDTSLSLPILAFTVGVGLVTALVFGVAPAMSASRLSPYEALKEQGRTVAGDRRVGFRNTLVVVQIALSLVLIVAAGLFIRTFQRVSAAPLGLQVEPLMIVRLDIKRSAADGGGRLQLLERLRDAAANTPGVMSAALSRIEPLSGAGWNTRVDLPDRAPGARFPWLNGVTPGWFHTFGLRILGGRDFDAGDSPGRPGVAIANEAFARRFFNGQNPVGRRVSMGGPGGQQSYDIVGLVSDSAYRSPREGLPATIYLPFAQMMPTPAFPPAAVLAVEVRQGAWAGIENRLGQALTGVDAGVAFTFRPFADRVRSTMIQERLVAALSGFFGALALLLAGVGLYGVTAYGVSRRRTEIGVRMALGAEPGRVVRLVLARVAWLVAVGVIVGGAISLWAAKFLGTLLFGLTPRDPATLAGAVLVLVAVGLVTAWFPARRASRIDPTEVLRES